MNITLLDRVLYAGYCIKCCTSVLRFYVAIKLVQFFTIVGMERLADFISDSSGLSARLLEVFPELFNERSELR